jgi:hypothetical protein
MFRVSGGELDYMYVNKRGTVLVISTLLLLITLACRTADVFVAQATLTPTRTPRPTYTPIPTPTDTPVPTNTPTPRPTATATRRPVVVRPPTAKPAAPAAPQPAAPAAPQPAVSNMEFHVNPPFCSHSGMTYIKGTVYNDKSNPDDRYAQAIVVMGAPDGNTIYGDPVKAGDDGVYTFILNSNGAYPGNFGVWLVDPTMKRKSDIGGPIVTNNLGPDDPKSCWAGGVDFWK